MSDLLLHARMLADKVRCTAYAQAIAAVVRPGDVVVDLGTGTGLHAVLACKAGTRKVFAIEESSIVDVARQIAVANGVADRIEFIHGRSNDVSVPFAADVLIADVRGVLPYFATSLASVLDARERFLKPGSRIIPLRDRVHAALVESSAARLLHDDAWTHDGVDMAPARSMASSATHKHVFARDEMLSAPSVIAELDYMTFTSPDLSATVELGVTRAGVAHGLALWFDALLARDVHVTNAPGEQETIYGQLYVPFESPFGVGTGDVVVAEITARLLPGADDYLWRWRTSLIREGARSVLFDQSSFFAGPVTRDE